MLPTFPITFVPVGDGRWWGLEEGRGDVGVSGLLSLNSACGGGRLLMSGSEQQWWYPGLIKCRKVGSLQAPSIMLPVCLCMK